MEQVRLRPEAASPCDLNHSAVCFGIFLVERPKLNFPAQKGDLLTATGVGGAVLPMTLKTLVDKLFFPVTDVKNDTLKKVGPFFAIANAPVQRDPAAVKRSLTLMCTFLLCQKSFFPEKIRALFASVFPQGPARSRSLLFFPSF